MSTPARPPSEEVLSAKTDVCISNMLVQTSMGLGVGVVLSAVLFKRRAWPVWISTGFGAGSAYSDCNRLFNPAAIPGYKIVGQEEKKPL
ncbi:DUF543-domain-containing protein [Atractiella rhizophila]|nr:DUF543-domain-containing protein [Atractiella rhizophila]